jgi:hypothetical protein
MAQMVRCGGLMVLLIPLALLLAMGGFSLLRVMLRRAAFRQFMTRNGWTGESYDWLAQTREASWRGVPVSYQRWERSSMLRLARPAPVTLHITRRGDWRAALHEAFRGDEIALDSELRYFGENADVARRLDEDADVRRAQSCAPSGMRRPATQRSPRCATGNQNHRPD